jgi:hypothetical protein
MSERCSHAMQTDAGPCALPCDCLAEHGWTQSMTHGTATTHVHARPRHSSTHRPPPEGARAGGGRNKRRRSSASAPANTTHRNKGTHAVLATCDHNPAAHLGRVSRGCRAVCDGAAWWVLCPRPAPACDAGCHFLAAGLLLRRLGGLLSRQPVILACHCVLAVGVVGALLCPV